MKKSTWEQFAQKRPATERKAKPLQSDTKPEISQHAPPEAATSDDLRELSVLDTTLTPIGMTKLIKDIEKQHPGLTYWGISHYPEGRSDHAPGRYLRFCRESKMKGGNP
jgi:hypothetical protein